jgi:aminomethyltransferase
MERVESGLLSFGGDTDAETNPYEVRMGKYIDIDAPDHCIGIRALREIQNRGPKRHQLGVVLDETGKIPVSDLHSQVFRDATPAGKMTTNAWSPRMEKNIGICLVWTGVMPGDRVTVELPNGKRVDGAMCELPFL